MEAVTVVVDEIEPVATCEHAAEIFFAGQLAMNDGVGIADRFWNTKVVDVSVVASMAVTWIVDAAGVCVTVLATTEGL